MKKRTKWYVFVCLLTLCSFFFIYTLPSINCSKKINVNITQNAKSAHDLVAYAKPYVDKFLENKYHIGEIDMKINKDHEGDVRITIIEDKPIDNPKVIQVQMNTEKHVLTQIECLGNNDKNNPGKILFENWHIDSVEAVERAKLVLKDKTGINYDSVYLRAYHNYKLDKEYWRAEFINYWIEIDPFSGEILDQGSK